MIRAAKKNGVQVRRAAFVWLALRRDGRSRTFEGVRRFFYFTRFLARL